MIISFIANCAVCAVYWCGVQLKKIACHSVIPIVIFSVILLLFLGSMYLDWPESNTLASFIASLFSALAFAGVIYALILQTKEMTARREDQEEDKRHREKTEKSQKAVVERMSETAYLGALDSFYKIAQREIDQGEEKIKSFDTDIDEIKVSTLNKTIAGYVHLFWIDKMLAEYVNTVQSFGEQERIREKGSTILDEVIMSASNKETEGDLITKIFNCVRDLRALTIQYQDKVNNDSEYVILREEVHILIAHIGDFADEYPLRKAEQIKKHIQDALLQDDLPSDEYMAYLLQTFYKLYYVVYYLCQTV